MVPNIKAERTSEIRKSIQGSGINVNRGTDISILSILWLAELTCAQAHNHWME